MSRYLHLDGDELPQAALLATVREIVRVVQVPTSVLGMVAGVVPAMPAPDAAWAGVGALPTDKKLVLATIAALAFNLFGLALRDAARCEGEYRW